MKSFNLLNFNQIIIKYGHNYHNQHNLAFVSILLNTKGADFFKKAKECFENARDLGHENAVRSLKIMNE